MKEIKAPNQISFDHAIFLAGSIEMGTAVDWQKQVKEGLKDTNWTLYNPRREDWDSSWIQSIENDQFVEQVTWELDAMERAEFILMYFAPNTKFPISLLELGLWTHPTETRSSKLVVVCPEGFWRKGNVDVVCRRYHVQQFAALEDAIRYFKEDFKILSPKSPPPRLAPLVENRGRNNEKKIRTRVSEKYPCRRMG